MRPNRLRIMYSLTNEDDEVGYASPSWLLCQEELVRRRKFSCDTRIRSADERGAALPGKRTSGSFMM